MGVKFKDTILRKWALNETTDKEIYYIVLLEFDKLSSDDRKLFFKNFHTYLPTCLKDNIDFVRHINLKRYAVMDLKQWNSHKYFGMFPIEVVATAP